MHGAVREMVLSGTLCFDSREKEGLEEHDSTQMERKLLLVEQTKRKSPSYSQKTPQL